MSHFTSWSALLTPWSALFGGMLIGLAASLLYLLDGRIAGISGILGESLSRVQGERAWRWWFLAGLLLGGLGLHLLAPARVVDAPVSPKLVVVAGLLVGFGTRFGNGCTSGHGVCGLSRGSKRSIVATCTFMATGMLATFVVRHLLGGGW